jgi:hypothetical protein
MGVNIAYWFASLLLVGFPAAVVVGIAMQVSVVRRSWARRISFSGMLIAFWMLTIGLLRWDPLAVVEWYGD